MKKFHPFHLVDQSPWPLVGSMSGMSWFGNFFFYILGMGSFNFFLIGTLSVLSFMILWWRDVIRESTFQGSHSEEVQSGLYFGMMMFIMSEVMFFFGFFFGFFFISLVPSEDLGGFPPSGIQPLSFMDIPMLNTLILLSSGLSITWCHHSILESKKMDSLISGFLTSVLGLAFSFFQYMEYFESSFSMADGVYGSFFFIMTGFHGMHVIVGLLMIVVSLIRTGLMHFSFKHHIGFEVSAWYWHFVDVVWLFLFVSLYWWGS